MEFIKGADLSSLLEVERCGGLFRAVQSAIVKSGKDIPLTVTVLSAEGDVLAVR